MVWIPTNSANIGCVTKEVHTGEARSILDGQVFSSAQRRPGATREGEAGVPQGSTARQMSHPDRRWVGKEVLVGGPVNPDGMLLVVPSLDNCPRYRPGTS